jgi:hypothetical protein
MVGLAGVEIMTAGGKRSSRWQKWGTTSMVLSVDNCSGGMCFSNLPRAKSTENTFEGEVLLLLLSVNPLALALVSNFLTTSRRVASREA